MAMYNPALVAKLNAERVAQEQVQQQAQQKTQMQSPSTSSVSPLPPQPGTSQYIAQKGPNGQLYVQKGYEVTQQVTQGNQTTYTIAPIKSQTPTPSVPTPIITQGYIPPAKTVFNTTPIINTPEKLHTAFQVTAIVATPILGPSLATEAGIAGVTTTGIITNQALGVGISAGIKAVATGQLITPNEALQAAAISGPLVIGGQGANQALGITGKGIIPTASRIAVGSAFGAGLTAGEQALTEHRVTLEKVAQGAAFGAGLSAAGEIAGAVNSRYDVTGRVSGRFQDITIKANIDRLANIDEKYQQAYMNFERFKPTFGERVVMHMTGLEPYKPAPGTISLPKAPTTGIQANLGQDVGGLKVATLEISGLVDAGTRLQGISIATPFTPLKLSSGIIISSSPTQLESLEQMSNQPLPRSELQQIAQKIDEQNFDTKTTNAKIDAQIRQSGSFDLDAANTNMKRALQEAATEAIIGEHPVAQPTYFKTGIGDDNGYSSNIKNDYLIKQPIHTNLDLSEQIQIRSRNTFDASQANARIDELLNTQPVSSKYEDYHSIMSRGLIRTATRTANSDVELSIIEQMTNQPLPRTSVELNNSERMARPILPNSFEPEIPAAESITITQETLAFNKPKTIASLIPTVNPHAVGQGYEDKMGIQTYGVDTFTRNVINNRLMPTNAFEVSNKINIQISGIGSRGYAIQDQIIGPTSRVGASSTTRQNSSTRTSSLLGQSSSQGIKSKQAVDVLQGLGLNQGVAQTVRTTPTTKIDQGQDTIQQQHQSNQTFFDTHVGTSYLTIPEIGSKFEGKGYDIFGVNKKTKVKSYEFEHPILTGFQLLGKEKSGDEPFF